MGQREGGTRTTRIEFSRETLRGITDADPTWFLYSDIVENYELDPSQSVFQQRGIGDIDPRSFLPGPETGKFTVKYHMQRWPKTSGGAAQDASFDGLERDAFNQLTTSHSVLVRQVLGGGAIAGGNRHVYSYSTGALIEMVKFMGDPSEGGPVMVELSYVAEQSRSYMISQPIAGGVVTIASTDAADTTQTVTVENAAGTAEVISLNGTTPVAGSTSFSDIDAVRLSAECVGDVTITHTAIVVMTIAGVTSQQTAGDLGLPLLGSGSHGSAYGVAYEIFVGDVVQFGGADLADNINAFSIKIENEIEATPRYDSRVLDLEEGKRTITVEADVYGDYETHTSIVRHLAVESGTIQWTFTSGDIQVTGAVMTTVGKRVYNQESVNIDLANVFTGSGLTVSNSN